jgi:DNA-binding NtrC family response regulator
LKKTLEKILRDNNINCIEHKNTKKIQKSVEENFEIDIAIISLDTPNRIRNELLSYFNKEAPWIKLFGVADNKISSAEKQKYFSEGFNVVLDKFIQIPQKTINKIKILRKM